MFSRVEKGCIGMNHWNKAVDASSNDLIRSSISEISKQNMVYYHLHNLVYILKNRSAKKILNNSALNIEPCVTPNTISIQVLSVGDCFFLFLFFVFYLISSHVLHLRLEDKGRNIQLGC